MFTDRYRRAQEQLNRQVRAMLDDSAVVAPYYTIGPAGDGDYFRKNEDGTHDYFDNNNRQITNTEANK